MHNQCILGSLEKQAENELAVAMWQATEFVYIYAY